MVSVLVKCNGVTRRAKKKPLSGSARGPQEMYYDDTQMSEEPVDGV